VLASAASAGSISRAKAWPESQRREWTWISVAVITAVGAVLRFHDLGAKSLWLDEVVEAQATHFNSFGALIAWVRFDVDQMPLYPAINWLLRGFGDGDVALRLPSALFGTLGILAAFWLGKRLFGTQIALLAALFTAINPFLVWYSQEARPYSLFVLLTTLQMLFAYRARRDGRILDWGGLAVFSILNIYTHYMALGVTGAAYAYIVFGVLSDWRAHKPIRLQIARGFFSWVLLGLAYLPWIHGLSALLRSGNKGFARYGPGGDLWLAHGLSLMERLGFIGLLLVALVVGLVAIALRAGRSQDGSGLILAWLVLPMAALALKLGSAVFVLDARYVSFVLPALIVVCAVAVTELARFIVKRVTLPRIPAPRQLPAVAVTAVAALLVLQTIPALAAAISQPKDDYRGVAAYVTGVSPSNATVLALGKYPPFVVLGLGHYLKQSGSRVVVVDGERINDEALANMRTSPGEIWGVVFQSTPDELLTAQQSGLQTKVFTGLLLVRPDPGLSAVAQAQMLLAWDGPTLVKNAPH
jgi:4-amino-4-deoxy-L-arabinose transferase-like glycosyltransferase